MLMFAITHILRFLRISFKICLTKPEGELSFELNNHVILNKESDSWRELPVLKEDSEEMLKG